jgi:hypothetical protein
LKLLAYIDPGTGSFALQTMLGAVLGAGYAVRNRIRTLFGKLKKDSGPGDSSKH